MADQPEWILLEDPDLLHGLIGSALWQEITRRGGRFALAVTRASAMADLSDVERYLKENSDRIAAGSRRRDSLSTVGEMCTGMVHELRNVISSIRGFAQLAREKNQQGEDVAGLLEKIERQSQVSFESLLSLVREGTGTAAPFDANQVVRSSVTLVRHQLNLSAVQLVVDLAVALPPAVGRARDLQHVLVNLLLNSQQAMTEGGTVSVSTSFADGWISVRVSDTGPGVPHDLREKVFEAFFSTKGDRGTGLGLAISKQLMERNDGSLQLEEAAVGARFIARLRCAEK